MSEDFKSPYGRHSTAGEVISGTDMAGKRVVVTGDARRSVRAGSALGSRGARVRGNLSHLLEASAVGLHTTELAATTS